MSSDEHDFFLYTDCNVSFRAHDVSFLAIIVEVDIID